MEIEEKFYACNLCDALHRNINDDFENVSFEILSNGDIQGKIILNDITDREIEYVNDISVEFSAKQENDCILKPIVETVKSSPLKHVIYQRFDQIEKPCACNPDLNPASNFDLFIKIDLQ